MGCNGLIALFFFCSLICYNIKYILNNNNELIEQRRDAARLPRYHKDGNFLLSKRVKQKYPKEARILRLVTCRQNIFFVT